jgi:hypothetical protein
MESSQVATPGPSTPARNNIHLFTANVWGDTDTGEAVAERCLFPGTSLLRQNTGSVFVAEY